MDEVLRYLAEADACITSYQDISLADSFFESDETDKNEEASSGAIEALKKAFSRLVEIVKDIIKSVKDFFETQFLSADEKKRYKEFKAMVKSSPDLKNQKVFIEDFREYEKIYDEAMKQLEEASKKDNFSNEVVEKIKEGCLEALKKLNEKYGDTAKRAAHSVTLSVAMDLADSCQLAAMGMNAALNAELVSLEEVEKSLGDKKVKKFKKDMEAAAKNGILHRAKVFFLRRKSDTLNALAKKEIRRITAFTNLDKDGKLKAGKPIVDSTSLSKGMVANIDTVSDAIGKDDAASVAKTLATTAVKSKLAEMTIKRNAKRTANIVKNGAHFFTGK